MAIRTIFGAEWVLMESIERAALWFVGSESRVNWALRVNETVGA